MQITKKHTCTGHNAAIYALCAGLQPHQWLSAGGDGWVVAWDQQDPETGRLLASVEAQVFSLLALPEHNTVVAGNMNGGVHWINLSHPELTRNIQHHQKGVYDLQQVGNHVFSVGGDGILSRWDVLTGRALESLHLSNKSLRCLTYSPELNELAIGASDGNIYLLDANTFAIKTVLKNAHDPSVFCLLYKPGGKQLFSGGRDAMLRLWNLESNTPINAWPAHRFTLNHLVFSPDGHYLATASRDRTIKIWDAQTVELLKVIDTIRYGGHVNSVNKLLWMEEGLISCSDDRTMAIWEFKV
ncbi:MAG: hypothetical protein IT270_05270 [Saprospiraceae bacterium]|nr:hypothetical protein [Saprospiraceae bacterium]